MNCFTVFDRDDERGGTRLIRHTVGQSGFQRSKFSNFDSIGNVLMTFWEVVAYVMVLQLYRYKSR